jgi:tetratricopeptide (TPR) repeat protein
VSLLSLLLTAPYLLFFANRTISRNPDWRDDRTLFLSSYSVCPDSAKLNLQIAKLYLNDQNFTAAQFHIDRALSIDPTFCDISHQRALLALVAHADFEEAIVHLLDSLKCVYTLASSWKLLSQIWEERMRSSPKDFALVSTIGDQCYEAGKSSLPTRQWVS